MKKITGTFLIILCVIVIIFTAEARAADFPDMEDHWSVPYVNYLVERGAIDGINDYFCPDVNVSLAQYVKIIIASTVDNTIQPAEYGHWAANYMEKANELVIIEIPEFEDQTLWDEPLTRYGMARIAYATLTNILEEKDPAYSTFKPLQDVDCTKCYPFVEKTYAMGIVTGKPGNLFDGDAFMTRAEACVVISRILDPSLRAKAETNPEDLREPENNATEIDDPTVDEKLEVIIQYTDINHETAYSYMQSEPAPIIIDVRSQAEFETLHINGSINIPVDVIEEVVENLIPDKNELIIVYCGVGARAARAGGILASLGYENVHNMGGIDNWQYNNTVSKEN